MDPRQTQRGGPRTSEPLGGADFCAGLLAVATGLAHLSYALHDTKVPADPGLYYRDVPAALAALSAGELGSLLPILTHGSGWMNLLLAAVHTLAGGAPQAVPLLGVLWVSVLILATWRLARHRGGPIAGLIATALCAAAPIVIVQGRSLWIHVPEAALALGVAAALTADPRLRSPLHLLGAAIGGALLLSLRESGLGWALVAISPLLWSREGRPSWPKLSIITLFWAIGAAASLADIVPYLVAKAAARQGYVERLQPLSWQGLGQQVGLSVALLPAALLPNRRADRLLRLLPALTLALALLLWWIFRAGIDNFTLIGPAVALAVAAGLSRLGWAGVAIAAQIWLLAFLPQWFPSRVFRPLRMLPPRGAYVSDPEPNQYYRPWRGYGAAQVEAVIAAACGDAPCVIAVDQGLFLPFGEEPGRLGLALLGWSQVTLLDLRHGPRPGQPTPDLLVTWDCPNKQDSWLERFPESARAAEALAEAQAMAPLWGVAVSGRCATQWWSPEGAVSDPSRLPTTGGTFAPKMVSKPSQRRRERGEAAPGAAPSAGPEAPIDGGEAARSTEAAPRARPSPIRTQRPRVRRRP